MVGLAGLAPSAQPHSQLEVRHKNKMASGEWRVTSDERRARSTEHNERRATSDVHVPQQKKEAYDS
jgi:hypothetical protein